jgi:hypothetical protein
MGRDLRATAGRRAWSSVVQVAVPRRPLVARLRAAQSLEDPSADITLDLPDRPGCVDDVHVCDRAIGVHEDVVEPAPAVHGRFDPLGVDLDPGPAHEPGAGDSGVTP